MRRIVNRKPSRGGGLALGLLPFILIAAVYLFGSNLRLAANPDDKLLPSPASLGAAIHQVAVEEDQRSGNIVLWLDTGASLKRLATALAISAALGLALGVAIGLIPYVQKTLAPVVAAIAMIPPLAILPILFIVAGL